MSAIVYPGELRGQPANHRPMLRDGVESRLRDRCGDGPFLFPAYDDYCFGNVPATVASVFGLEAGQTLPDDVFEGLTTDVEHVVLVLIDGFGLEGWKRDHGHHEFLGRLTDRGTMTPLTSIYPSETAAAITTVHTGSLPAQHGVIGWDVYLPDREDVVETFAWEPRDDGSAGADPLFDVPTIYERLADDGVAAHVYQPPETMQSGYDDLSLAGAERHAYENAAGMALSLRRELEAATGPSYHYAYLPHVDAMAHRHGTTSEEYQAQLSMLVGCLERELAEEIGTETAAETLLLVTADHGLVDTDPATYVDLLDNPMVRDSLRTNGAGTPIPPVGGPRNAHLHLREGTVEAVASALREEYDARTFTRADARDRGLFGDGPTSDRFDRQCGDLIVTHRSRSLYHGDDNEHVGRHGGLHPTEMLVPFATATLEDL